MGAAVRFSPLCTIKLSPEDLSVTSVSLTTHRRVFEGGILMMEITLIGLMGSQA